jgi:DNA-binding transcriptional LysR family regulator
VVVSLEALDCLDTLLWLRTGSEASRRLGVSQPSISRNVRQASSALGVTLSKLDGEWVVLGDPTLLNLERGLHQEYRWRQDMPLRLEAQYYSGPLFCEPAPDGWLPGRFDFLEIHTPLHHLRSGVIDAWIGSDPDVPDGDDPQLTCFHLTRMPTHLVVADGHPLVALGDGVSLDDVRHYPSLALPDNAFPKLQRALQRLGLWNLPMHINRYDRQRWEGKVSASPVVGYATVFTLGLYEPRPVVLPLPLDLEVGDSLVVKRSYAQHPRL